MKRVQRTSYGAVVVFGDGADCEYLLIQRIDTRHRFWALPKGRPDSGESPVETGLREAREEAGARSLVVLSDEPMFESYQFRDRHRNELIEKSVGYFLVRTSERHCEPDGHEAGDCAWLPYGQARERLEYDAAKAVIDKAHALVQTSSND